MKRSFFNLCLILSTLLLVYCNPEAEDIPNPSPTVTGFATDSIAGVFHAGDDPCPMKVGTIQVYCYEGAEYQYCEADSVVVTKVHESLEVKFPNGTTESYIPTIDSAIGLSVYYTCKSVERIDHNIELVFFRYGSEVATETAHIEVAVY